MSVVKKAEDFGGIKWVNASGTSGECENCKPWKEHWKNLAKSKFPEKCACGCGTKIGDNGDTHGAHIITILVNANPKKTCGLLKKMTKDHPV